jgi:hypothetical protein
MPLSSLPLLATIQSELALVLSHQHQLSIVLMYSSNMALADSALDTKMGELSFLSPSIHLYRLDVKEPRGHASPYSLQGHVKT